MVRSTRLQCAAPPGLRQRGIHPMPRRHRFGFGRTCTLLRPARLAAALLAACALLGLARATPLEVYGGLPSLEEVSLSPDGGKIAYVRTEGEKRLIVVRSLADDKVLKALRVGDAKLRGIEWADDSRILVYTSSTGMPWGLRGEDAEWYQLLVVDVRNGEAVSIPNQRRSHDSVRLMNVLSGEVMPRSIDGHTVLFVPGVFVGERTYPCLIRYDLDSNTQQVVKLGDRNSRSWLVAADGNIAAEEKYEEETGRWILRTARGGRMEVVASGQEGIDVPQVLGFGPTEDSLLTQYVEYGHNVWKLLSLREGSFGERLQAGQAPARPIEDPSSHLLIGAVSGEDRDEAHFLDPARQKHWDAILRAYGTDRPRFVSASSDFHRLIVLVQGAKLGYQYQLVDLEKRRTRSVGDVYEGITLPLEVRRIDYEAADGLSIPAFLTLPPGRAPKNLPLIVLPHGGPAAADTLRFDWWAQALADQGYAVLQPNFRGSTISQEFLERGYGEYGRKMQTDLSDGVRYLTHEGIADPARVCIVGASYGGYAALAGAALDHGVYRCAASVAGVADLSAYLKWVDAREWSSKNSSQRYWDRFLGVQGPKDPRLDEISPIKHVDAIDIPVLLIHGKDDTVVPYDQSDEMFDALRHANKPVEFVKLKDEDHWLSRGATRLQMLQSLVAFLKKNNPPD
jgi:dipeptidyl aminopeptidase/acylaminoacyl peptidase